MGSLKAKLVAIVCYLFGPRKIKPTDDDRKKLDFKTSTKKIGVSNSDKIRDTFRPRWIKKH